MEKKLEKLFDYQKFEDNPRLAKLIRETEARYGTELDDDDLANVAAAGVTPGGTPDGNVENNLQGKVPGVQVTGNGQ